MALMIPESLDDSGVEPTLGERLTYDFLRRGLDDRHVVWFDPNVAGKNPDFIIYGPGIGLLVLEVKDWKPESLLKVDHDWVLLNTPQGEKRQRNPLETARRYAHTVTTKLSEKGVLKHGSGPFRGKLKFPWGRGVVMTHIGRSFCQDNGLDEVFPASQVLSRVDLEHPFPDQLLPKRLDGMFAVRFPVTGMGDREVRILRSVLHPEVVLRQPNKQPTLALEPDNDVAVYDYTQESLAKSLGDGHRVIRGVAGSGKTRILVSRAIRLARLHPQWKIGFFCYNLTLEAWLREAIKSQAPDEADRIEVRSFTEWMKETARVDSIEEWESDELPESLRQRFIDGELKPPFEALMIDEAQDFRESWLRLCVAIVHKPPGMLVVAADGAQSIYKRGFTWKAAGIEATGNRTKILKTNYRNTGPIAGLARRFARLGVESNFEGNVLPVDDMELCPRAGPPPQIWRFASVEDQAAYIAAEARRRFGKKADGKVPYEEMAVLYPRTRWDGVEYLSLLCDALEKQVVPYVTIAKDADWKKRSALRQVQLAVSTIHSFKGLDTDTVFLTGPLQDDDPQTHRNLYYVALTRAQRGLVVTYVQANSHTECLLDAAAGRGAVGEPVGRLSLVRLGLASYSLRPETVPQLADLSDQEVLAFIRARKDEPGGERLIRVLREVVERYGGDDEARIREAEGIWAALGACRA
jgi:hypothetical protein